MGFGGSNNAPQRRRRDRPHDLHDHHRPDPLRRAPGHGHAPDRQQPGDLPGRRVAPRRRHARRLRPEALRRRQPRRQQRRRGQGAGLPRLLADRRRPADELAGRARQGGHPRPRSTRPRCTRTRSRSAGSAATSSPAARPRRSRTSTRSPASPPRTGTSPRTSRRRRPTTTARSRARPGASATAPTARASRHRTPTRRRGTYNVTVTVTDDRGGVTSITNPVTVVDPPPNVLPTAGVRLERPLPHRDVHVVVHGLRRDHRLVGVGLRRRHLRDRRLAAARLLGRGHVQRLVDGHRRPGRHEHRSPSR